MAEKKATVKVKNLVRNTVSIRIVGDSPLIVHRWTPKGKRMIPAGKRAAELNGIADKEDYQSPMEQFIENAYWITEDLKPTEYTKEAFEKVADKAKFGTRADAIKDAAISGAYAKKWIPNKKNVQGLFFINHDYIDKDGYPLVELKYGELTMREDVVTLSGVAHSPDLRWRPQYTDWYIDLTVNYDADGIYSLDDIVNMINVGGYYFGIGEWRPEKGGQFGMFHVDATTKKEVVE